MTLTDPLTQRLREIAEREGTTDNALLQKLLDEYEKHHPQPKPPPDYDPIEDYLGMFDDDITDLSTTVRESIRKLDGRRLITHE